MEVVSSGLLVVRLVDSLKNSIFYIFKPLELAHYDLALQLRTRVLHQGQVGAVEWPVQGADVFPHLLFQRLCHFC